MYTERREKKEKRKKKAGEDNVLPSSSAMLALNELRSSNTLRRPCSQKASSRAVKRAMRSRRSSNPNAMLGRDSAARAVEDGATEEARPPTLADGSKKEAERDMVWRFGARPDVLRDGWIVVVVIVVVFLFRVKL